MSRLSACVLAAMFCWASLASRAAAEDGSPYRLDLRIDLPLVALGGAVSFAGLLKRAPLPECAPYCPTSSLNALDRTAIHFDSSTASTLGNIVLPIVLVLPLVLDAVDTRMHGWLVDVFVIGQALLLTQAITQLTKFAVSRNSPAVYSGNPNSPGLHDFDVSRSFFSGHTSSAFATSTAYTVTYWLRHPHDPLRWVILGVGAALSLFPGACKLFAGEHFWTDVFAGAAAGAAVGVLVPILHVPTDS